VDGEAFAKFIEKLKLKIQSKDLNLGETLEQLDFNTPQFIYKKLVHGN